MQLDIRPGEEVHGVMIRIAAHEAEEVADPVRDPKAQHLLVEADGALDIGSEEGDMPELERSNAGDLLILAAIAPMRQQLDVRSLVVRKRQHLRDPWTRLVAHLAADPA